MEDSEIKLLVRETVDEIAAKEGRKSLLQNAIIAAIILPLAYLGITSAAKTTASNKVEQLADSIKTTYETALNQSVEKTVEAQTSARIALAKAEEASDEAEKAKNAMIGSADNIIDNLLKTEIVKDALDKLDETSVYLVECKDYDSSVGQDSADELKNAYLDRMKFQCPNNTVMTSFKFKREPVGQQGPDMKITAKCCSISVQ